MCPRNIHELASRSFKHMKALCLRPYMLVEVTHMTTAEQPHPHNVLADHDYIL